MAKHTPGPWAPAGCMMRDCGEIPLERGGNMRQLANGLPSHGVPVMAIRDLGDDNVQLCLVGLAVDMEDAHLIAAAPDLLAACKAALSESIGFMVSDQPGADVRGLLRAAIAKAEGGNA